MGAIIEKKWNHKNDMVTTQFTFDALDSYTTLSLQEEFAGVVARVESLGGQMGASQSTRQVEGLFESLLSESFGGN